MSQSQCGRLVGHHPTNKLIGREPIPHQKKPFPTTPCEEARIPGISADFPTLSQREGQVTHVLLTRSPLTTRSENQAARSTCMC